MNVGDWHRRQTEEARFWGSVIHRFNDPSHEDYWLRSIKDSMTYIKDGTRIYIGPGPTSAFHTKDTNLIGIDPLCRVYKNQGYDKWYIPIVAVGECLPIGDMVVDIVYCFNTLDHAYCWKSIIDEIFRVLKAEGTFFLHCDIHDTPEPLHTSIDPDKLMSYVRSNFVGNVYISYDIVTSKGTCGRSVIGELIKR